MTDEAGCPGRSDCSARSAAGVSCFVDACPWQPGSLLPRRLGLVGLAGSAAARVPSSTPKASGRAISFGRLGIIARERLPSKAISPSSWAINAPARSYVTERSWPS